MRTIFLAVLAVLAAGRFSGLAKAQTQAITKEGQHVILFSNGTWKFESEMDSLLHEKTTLLAEPATPSSPTEIPAAPVPVVIVVPKPKPPRVYSLECSALVNTTTAINSDAYVSVSKDLVILKDDSTTAFSVSMMKSRKSSLMWTTTIPGKPCITADNKIIIVLKDGTRYTIVTDSKPNCDGSFLLLFGNLDGKDTPLQSLKQTEISSVRIFTQKGYVEANFDDESAKKFKAAMNCLAKNL